MDEPSIEAQETEALVKDHDVDDANFRRSGFVVEVFIRPVLDDEGTVSAVLLSVAKHQLQVSSYSSIIIIYFFIIMDCFIVVWVETFQCIIPKIR